MPAQQFGEFGANRRCPSVALRTVLELSPVALVAVVCPAAPGVRRGVTELEFAPSVRAGRVFLLFGFFIPHMRRQRDVLLSERYDFLGPERSEVDSSEKCYETRAARLLRSDGRK